MKILDTIIRKCHDAEVAPPGEACIMLSLSQTSGHAILALSCLCETAGRFVLAKDIAACTGVSLPYLSKVLDAMRRTGLIEGKRGYRGGFGLARPAAEISRLHVAEAVDGQRNLTHF
jgi:Rrf2 family protein